MPSLTPDDRRHLLGPTGRRCDTCREPIRRGYCRACDVFYETCPCQRPDAEVHRGPGHRTYDDGSPTWDGVGARP